jgi:hypothetical protein
MSDGHVDRVSLYEDTTVSNPLTAMASGGTGGLGDIELTAVTEDGDEHDSDSSVEHEDARTVKGDGLDFAEFAVSTEAAVPAFQETTDQSKRTSGGSGGSASGSSAGAAGASGLSREASLHRASSFKNKKTAAAVMSSKRRSAGAGSAKTAVPKGALTTATFGEQSTVL